MKFVLFYHSLVSDWNHGNAHFLRGVAIQIAKLGHSIVVYEPLDGWSRLELEKEHGEQNFWTFNQNGLTHGFFSEKTERIETIVDGADVVVVHEWNTAWLIKTLGELRRRNHFRLLFHDTHHRSVTEPGWLLNLPLEHYDGVLAFGDSVRAQYEQLGWNRRVWTWHEAADTESFFRYENTNPRHDVVWVGNWGGEERRNQLINFFFNPVSALKIDTEIYGVRYPESVKVLLKKLGIRYRGWIANYKVPKVFSEAKITLHIPRHAYLTQLPDIPTIRVFEALACGIPLITAQWQERCDDLFSLGKDYLVAHTPQQMKAHIKRLLNEPQMREEFSKNGRTTILKKHTCGHRVAELFNILKELK